MKNLKFSVLALCVGAFLGGKAVAQVPNYVPTNGLVGWWPFNGNANDESGNGNNGTVNGATLTTDRFGNANNAYKMYTPDSGGDISLAEINLSDVFTISSWAKLEYFNSANVSNIISKYNGAFGFELNIDAPVPSSRGLYGLIGPENDPNNSVISNILPTTNNWNFVVWTKNGGNSKLYINNNLIYETNTANNITQGSGNVFFGRSQWGGNPFKGDLDDIGIWNQELTPADIDNLYNATICSADLNIAPSVNSLQTGNTANFTATTNDLNSTIIWQSDLGQGFQTLNDYGNYSGTTTNTLSISNVQLANHNQPIRAISSAGNCTDTSNIATIQIADTCITTIYDTLYTTVTDTLIINTTLSLPAPNNENTILIYPNPASDHITIDNGNFAAMAGYSIKIENNAGQQVFQSLINQAQFYVDLSTWTGNGLYFVHLIDPQNNTVTVRKIVLQ
jgi:hypothetical protein